MIAILARNNNSKKSLLSTTQHKKYYFENKSKNKLLFSNNLLPHTESYFNTYCSCNVTKREGPTITDDTYTVCRRPRRLVFYWSIPHRTPITPQTQTVFSLPLLICCDQTQQYNTWHNMHLTQTHQRKCFHLIHKLCTYFESTGMSFNTKQQVLPPSLVLWSFAALNPAIYQTQRKSKT
jgi:hypothetical protein